jgi:putative ABC transport system permease protein
MEIKPILSSMRRKPSGLILIGLQVAITLAIVVNALFIIQSRLSDMAVDSGIDEANIFSLVTIGYTDDYDVESVSEGDIALITQLPGVVAAYATNALPMSDSGWSNTVEANREPGGHNINTAVYFANHRTLDGLGLNLIAGRWFDEAEVSSFGINEEMELESVIISADSALSLFTDIETPEAAIGRDIWGGADDDRKSFTVVGVVDAIKAPWRGWGNGIFEHVMFIPKFPIFGQYSRYVVRTKPGYRDEVMNSLPELLNARYPTRVLRPAQAFTEVRAEFFRDDQAMVTMLVAVIVMLLLINALGIIGLVSFWVQQRKKQIGTRRALGANRWHIVRYFLVENSLITCLGITLGLVLAIVLNNWLVVQLEVARLPLIYLGYGALVLFVLGLIAAAAPALNASRIAPAVATRSV